MINYRIAIPSYNRPENIKKKTLQLLEKYDISFDKIDLFLENQEQYDLYFEFMVEEIKYHDINLIICDTFGIKQKRNCIKC